MTDVTEIVAKGKKLLQPTYKLWLLWVVWLQSPLGRSSGFDSGKCRPWTHPSALASTSIMLLQLKEGWKVMSLSNSLLLRRKRSYCCIFFYWKTYLFLLLSCVSRVVCTECRSTHGLWNYHWFVWTICKTTKTREDTVLVIIFTAYSS